MPAAADEGYDVVVVGAGNAALCAALAARENGARVAVLERATKREHGGNSRFTMASMRFAYDGIERPDGGGAAADRRGSRPRRLRRLHRGAVPGRSRLDQRRALRSRSGASSGERQPRHPAVDGGAGRALRAALGQPVVRRRRRPPPVLGRAHAAGRSRRPRSRARAAPRRLQGEDPRDPRDARHRPGPPARRHRRRWKWSSAASAGASARAPSFSPAAASRPTPSGGPSTSARRGASPRCAAPGTTPATASRWRSPPARARAVSGRAVTPCSGTAPLPTPATCACATPSRSTPIRSASWSTRAASASSTRASTSATTPTPATAAPCSSSPDASPGRSSTRARRRSCATSTRRLTRRAPMPRTLEELARTARRRRRRAVPRHRRAVQRGGRRTDVRSIRRARTAAARAASPSRRPTGRTAIDRPPFRAYAVTCGITFTYGGLAIDARARVLDEAGRPIPRLYAAGELVGGLFWDNYPGGAGLMAGVVFGRRAGVGAAAETAALRRLAADTLRAASITDVPSIRMTGAGLAAPGGSDDELRETRDRRPRVQRQRPRRPRSAAPTPTTSSSSSPSSTSSTSSIARSSRSSPRTSKRISVSPMRRSASSTAPRSPSSTPSSASRSGVWPTSGCARA